MSKIEDIAHKVENEAIKNPEAAAASLNLLGDAYQQRIFNQMQKDADQNNADFSIERGKDGKVQAINFTPLFGESGGLLHADSKTMRK